MVLTTELKVFPKIYELVYLIDEYTLNFPKYRKYTMGLKITNISLSLLLNLYEANSAVMNNNSRSLYLHKILGDIQLIRILLRLCNEKRIMSIKLVNKLTILLDEIGKLIGGWLRSLK